MAQFFRNNFNKAMSQLPKVNSQVQILRMEVCWVTHRNGTTTDTRDVVGLMDLRNTNRTTCCGAQNHAAAISFQ